MKGYVGLCRESPFTALLSEAIFAVTDDFLKLITAGFRGSSAHRSQGYQVVFFLFFLAQPPARGSNPAGKSAPLLSAGGDRAPAPCRGLVCRRGGCWNPQARQTKGSGWTGRYPLLTAGCGQDRDSCCEEITMNAKSMTGFPRRLLSAGRGVKLLPLPIKK